MKNLFAFLIATLIATPAALHAQAPAALKPLGPELTLDYAYVHSNAPPAQCNCFSLNGGYGSLALPIDAGNLAFVIEAGASHGTTKNAGTSYDLLLSTYTAGLRYRVAPRRRWDPFGQALLGVAHADGSLAGGTTPAANEGKGVFTAMVGGGLDRRLNDHWSIRVVEADYLVTTFTNGVNDHQNNIRVSAGISYRFGKR
jgi:peptidoglycan-associated lipoprotein